MFSGILDKNLWHSANCEKSERKNEGGTRIRCGNNRTTTITSNGREAVERVTVRNDGKQSKSNTKLRNVKNYFLCTLCLQLYTDNIAHRRSQPCKLPIESRPVFHFDFVQLSLINFSLLPHWRKKFHFFRDFSFLSISFVLLLSASLSPTCNSRWRYIHIILLTTTIYFSLYCRKKIKNNNEWINGVEI